MSKKNIKTGNLRLYIIYKGCVHVAKNFKL